MELNQLFEGSNNYKTLQADAARLSGKWAKSGLLEGISNEIERNNMAMILENQAKQIVSEGSQTGTGAIGTTNGAAGTGAEQWAGVALPLVRKVFAQIAAKDFVSVQPMNLPSGLVFYLDFKYGTSANGRTANNSLYGNVSDANNKMTVDEEVAGGLYGAGQFGYTISSSLLASAASVTSGSATSASIGYQDGLLPINFFTVAVTASAFSNPDLDGVRAFRLLSGSTNVDITTNPELTAVSASVLGQNVVFVVDKTLLSFVQTGTLSAQVRYQKQPTDNTRGDFEDNTTNAPIAIPEINVTLASEAIVAKTRKLKAQWTPEFAQDLNAYHSIDAEAELTSLLSEYISMEIDLELMDMLIQDAATTERWSAVNNKNWNSSTGAWSTAASAFFNTQGGWFGTLGTKIQKVSNKIHQKTLRGGANFLVVSPTVATILESIPGYAADTNGDKMDFAMGVQKVGNLNSRFKVYKNPYMTENVVLLGYRGSQFLETGAVYAPYIPLIMTPLVYDPTTFTPRKGIMTRYAKKMIRPEFYGKIFISDIATV
jgi:hypothetical protein